MNEMPQNLIGFSNRIDFMLGKLDHSEIVALSYLISAVVLFFLAFYIVVNGKRQKAKLAELEKLGMKPARKANVDNNG